MRFLETQDLYEFIMYSDTTLLGFVWVFLKTLNVSQHFETFKNDYDGAAHLRLALYRPKKNSYELELFDYQKRVSDVLFLNEPHNETQDAVVLEYKNIIKSQRQLQDPRWNRNGPGSYVGR
jgi:hypothetical protein